MGSGWARGRASWGLALKGSGDLGASSSGCSGAFGITGSEGSGGGGRSPLGITPESMKVHLSKQ